MAQSQHAGGTEGPSKRAARAAARRGRSGCRAADADLVAAVRDLASQVAPGAASPRIAAYLSYGDEPATDALVDALLGDGAVVVLPRREGERLAWVAVEAGTAYRVDALGIREPLGAGSARPEADLVLLPALSASAAGDRLGQGGGFYDRALAGAPEPDQGGPILAAIVFAHELVDAPAWPVEPHDIRVHEVIAVPCIAHPHHLALPGQG